MNGTEIGCSRPSPALKRDLCKDSTAHRPWGSLCALRKEAVVELLFSWRRHLPEITCCQLPVASWRVLFQNSFRLMALKRHQREHSSGRTAFAFAFGIRFINVFPPHGGDKFQIFSGVYLRRLLRHGNYSSDANSGCCFQSFN